MYLEFGTQQLKNEVEIVFYHQGKISFKELYMLLDEGTCLFNFDPHQVGAPISCDYVKFLFVHYFKLDLNINSPYLCGFFVVVVFD